MAARACYVEEQVRRDLRRKMVFVAGPRQVGKTTLARRLLGRKAGYLNWDVAEHREAILRRELPVSDFWVFDEIHKYRAWQSLLKGPYDSRRASQRILVTGSARLDFYRHGGDSLQGRYHLLRMHPLSAGELGLRRRDELLDLLTLGGFPEPFFGGREREARRWPREYRDLLVREEPLGPSYAPCLSQEVAPHRAAEQTTRLHRRAGAGASATTWMTRRPNFRSARCTRSNFSQREMPGGNVQMTRVS
jgi:hypothetical protein